MIGCVEDLFLNSRYAVLADKQASSILTVQTAKDAAGRLPLRDQPLSRCMRARIQVQSRTSQLTQLVTLIVTVSLSFATIRSLCIKD